MKTPSGHPARTPAPPATLERIGNRWAIQVLGALEHAGTLRYYEVRNAVEGISQRMLTLALRNLEQAGLVARQHYATFPPRVDYELTGLGRDLFQRLRELDAWMHANGVALPANQEQPDERPRTRRGT